MSEEETKIGRYPNGEEAVSKTVAPKGVEGSNPLPSAPKKKKPDEEIVYKLDFRRHNGDIRADIPKSLVYTLSARWADLLRVVPSHRWSTLEEIVQIVWDWEKRQYRKLFSRTRKQIEDGVKELVESGVLLSKQT
jgi:hypothetical protein